MLKTVQLREVTPLRAWSLPSSVFQVSFAGGPGKNKEVLSSPTPSISVSQTSDFHMNLSCSTEANLAEMEKTFQSEVNSTGELALRPRLWPLHRVGPRTRPGWMVQAAQAFLHPVCPLKLFIICSVSIVSPLGGYLGPREKIPLIQTLRQPLSAFQCVCN